MKQTILRIIGHIGIVLTWIGLGLYGYGSHIKEFIAFGFLFSVLAYFSKPNRYLGGVFNHLIYNKGGKNETNNVC